MVNLVLTIGAAWIFLVKLNEAIKTFLNSLDESRKDRIEIHRILSEHDKSIAILQTVIETKEGQ